MALLYHGIYTSAPWNNVFRLLTDIHEMSKWHAGIVDGDVAPGKYSILSRELFGFSMTNGEKSKEGFERADFY